MGPRALLIAAATVACAHAPVERTTAPIPPPSTDVTIEDPGPPRCLDLVLRPVGLVEVQRGRERTFADDDGGMWARLAGPLCADRPIVLWAVDRRAADAEALRVILEDTGATDVTVRVHLDEVPGTVLRSRAEAAAAGLAASVPPTFDFAARVLAIVEVPASCAAAAPAVVTLPLVRETGHVMVDTPRPADGACHQRALAVVPRTSLPIVVRAHGLAERFVP